MIFDKQFVDNIQKAIDTKDESFFWRYLSPKKQEIRKRAFSSALMVSAHKAKHLNKLDELECDAAIINLEDGVAPEFKRIALLAAALFLQQKRDNMPLLIVRINPLQEGGKEEIEILNRFYPDSIRIPKVRNLVEIKEGLKLIDDAIGLDFSVETKEAFERLHTFKQESRVGAAFLGILDLLSDLTIPQNLLKIGNPTIDYILARFLVDAKSAGIEPVSFVYQDYKNLDEFEAWCRYEKDMGFEAKACISPEQVKIVNRIFKSFDKTKALYIKKRFEEMKRQGVTGFVDEKYGFIDEPIYKDALNTLRKT